MPPLDHVPRGRRWQRLWRALHSVSLVGMNYGQGAVNDDSDAVAAGLLRGSHPVVFDGGAHFGVWTRHVLEVVPSARIFAFEPARATFTQLQTNLAGLADVYPLGLADAPGEHELYSDADTSTSASILPQDRSHWHVPSEFAARESIRLTTLDQFCSEHDIARIDLLKLDVEGAELSALRGAQRMLQENRIGLIQFEWGLPALSARVQLRDFFELLNGWTINRIVPDGVVPIDRWHERWEIPWTTNYLAIPPQ